MMYSANKSIVISEMTHKEHSNANLGYQNLVHTHFFTNIADPNINEPLF